MSFLFHSLILWEVLDHSISRAVAFGSSEGVKVGLKEVVVSHSQFARGTISLSEKGRGDF